MSNHWIQYCHLTFVGISFVLVFVCLLFSLFYLIQQWQLKHKKILPIFSELPSLELLDRYVIRCLLLGSLSIAILLFTGIYLAHVEWKNDWTKDNKFIFAIATWVWFVITIFLRFKLGIRGERFFYSILIGMGFLLASSLVAWLV